MNPEDLKAAALKEIDANRESILALARAIFAEPEEGYREVKTAAKVEAVFSEWGLKVQKGLALTGVRGLLECGAPGPRIGILSELDAVINPDHPAADPGSGAVHACGHFAQIAWMIGAGYGLRKILDGLAGSVVLFAVPAEEYINLEFRENLKKEKKIQYLGGKQELIRLGAFEDIDLAMMQHAQSEMPGRKIFFTAGSNGFVGKTARFLGRASHAGFAPERGINALNAFTLALSAIHAQRETFRDEDMVRVHPILTRGGDSVNVVPSEVTSEMYARARTVEAIKDTSFKVDRALKAGALATGTTLEISTTAGYMPLENDEKFSDIYTANAAELIGRENIHFQGPSGGSTDMGDLTHLIPGIHPWVGAFSGDLHSKDFKVEDEEMAFIIPAKLFAMTAIDLLADGAKKAKEIVSAFKPVYSREEYIRTLDSFTYKTRYEGEKPPPAE
jgi:amidohydrolase